MTTTYRLKDILSVITDDETVMKDAIEYWLSDYDTPEIVTEDGYDLLIKCISETIIQSRLVSTGTEHISVDEIIDLVTDSEYKEIADKISPMISYNTIIISIANQIIKLLMESGMESDEYDDYTSKTNFGADISEMYNDSIIIDMTKPDKDPEDILISHT